MKKYTFTLGLFLILTLVLTACFDIPNQPEFQRGKGYGSLRVSFSNYDRTVFPDKIFDKLEYTINGTPHTPGNFGLFSLVVGTSYTVDVAAFVGSAEAANGSAQFDIEENKITTVVVTLTANDATGTGSFSYYIASPADAAVQSISLTKLPAGTEGPVLNAVNNAGVITQTVNNVPAGFYLFTIQLKLPDGRVAGKGKAVHIYEKMTANFGSVSVPIVFTDDDFITKVPVTEIIVKDNSKTILGVPAAPMAITVLNNGAITLFTGETRTISVSTKSSTWSDGDIWSDISWESENANVTLDSNSGGSVAITGAADGFSLITVSAQNDDNDTPFTVSFTVNVRTPPNNADSWNNLAVNPLNSGMSVAGSAIGKDVMVIITSPFSGTAAAPGSSPGKIYWSQNGINWTAGIGEDNVEINAPTGFRSIAFGTIGTGANAKEMFVASITNNVYTSEDGKKWKGPILVPGLSTNSSSSLYLAILDGTIYGGSWFAIRSSDIDNWTDAGSPGTTIRGAVSANGVLVCVGDSTAIGSVRTRTSSSGWNTINMSGTQLLRVAYGNSAFVAVGGTNAAVSINNGSTWSFLTAANGISGSLSVTFGDGYFSAVDSSGNVRFSSNGIDWTAPHATGLQMEIAYGTVNFFAGKWIAGGNSGALRIAE